MDKSVKYPEILDYQWVRDLDILKRSSMAKTRGRKISDIPSAPLNLVLTIMYDMWDRPRMQRTPEHNRSNLSV